MPSCSICAAIAAREGDGAGAGTGERVSTTDGEESSEEGPTPMARARERFGGNRDVSPTEPYE